MNHAAASNWEDVSLIVHQFRGTIERHGIFENTYSTQVYWTGAWLTANLHKGIEVEVRLQLNFGVAIRGVTTRYHFVSWANPMKDLPS